MNISTKSQYASRALFHLAMAGATRTAPVRIADIAREQNIPKKYLEQILLLFKNAGILASKPGLKGGYYLARPLREVTMAEVLEVAEGPLDPVRCVSKTDHAPCPFADESRCALKTVWREAGEAVSGVLSGITLQDLVERAEELNAADPMFFI